MIDHADMTQGRWDSALIAGENIPAGSLLCVGKDGKVYAAPPAATPVSQFSEAEMAELKKQLNAIAGREVF
jgi:hypothetical protein